MRRGLKRVGLDRLAQRFLFVLAQRFLLRVRLRDALAIVESENAGEVLGEGRVEERGVRHLREVADVERCAEVREDVGPFDRIEIIRAASKVCKVDGLRDVPALDEADE